MKAANIRQITDLKNRTKELVQEVAEGGPSLVITQNGKPRVVLMGVEQHDRLHDTLAMLKLLSQSQERLARTGRTFKSAEVRRRLRAARGRSSKG